MPSHPVQENWFIDRTKFTQQAKRHEALLVKDRRKSMTMTTAVARLPNQDNHRDML